MKKPNNLLRCLLKSGAVNISPLRCAAAGALATALLCSALPASAASLVLTTTAPTPGPNDVYNFIGPDDKGAAIAGGDETDYVATGRPTQGQYFTTPSGSGTYLITDIWARH